MSDAARAEARRRKILQNSQNRLQIITGKIDNSLPTNGFLGEVKDEHLNNVLSRDLPDDSSVFTNNSNHLFQEETIPNVFEYIEPNTEAEVESKTERPNVLPKSNLIGNSKLRIVALAFVVYFVSIFSESTFNTYFFLPLAVLEVTEYFQGEPIKSNPMLTSLMALSGISSQSNNKLLTVIQLVQSMQKYFEDACLYTFVFVLLHTVKTST